MLEGFVEFWITSSDSTAPWTRVWAFAKTRKTLLISGRLAVREWQRCGAQKSFSDR
jgi:hypothetical protein